MHYPKLCQNCKHFVEGYEEGYIQMRRVRFCRLELKPKKGKCEEFEERKSPGSA